MDENKDVRFNQNADTTQNEQEQFADNTVQEEPAANYPLRSEGQIIKSNEESIYAFHWDAIEAEPKKKKKAQTNDLV